MIFLATIYNIALKNLVYLDESGIKTDLQREYGRAIRGVKVEDTKRGRHFRRTNVIGALWNKKHVAIEVYDTSMNAQHFETWFEYSLIKSIKQGCTIIMDNARFHRKNVLEQIAKKYYVQVLFLPPYSPDLNPIEKSWANMKRWLIDNANTYTTLEEAIYAYF